MSPDAVISAEGLSKRYFVGHNDSRMASDTLRDQLSRAVRTLARRTADLAHGRAVVQGDTVEDFWAIRDVTFDIRQGDRVGIVGRNGAGKSTLLKLLSRITEPTDGRIVIKGRVASLLEVGTGFHPELTGRENIFLNGAILGMSRVEIQRKFDEIVAFAEIDRFLDTPVKRYSSGMYVRLAFAVAAHLESDILIVDEVLAVGDTQFQKKCLGKLSDVSHSGRTVIFVSHNIEAVKSLCSSALMMQAGRLVRSGPVGAVVEQYLAGVRESITSRDGTWNASRPGPGVKAVAVYQDGVPTSVIVCGEPFDVKVTVEVDTSCRNLELGIGFRDEEGRDIIRLNNKHLGQMIDWPRTGTIDVTIQFPSFNWVYGSEVFLGLYFGYIGESYSTLDDILSLSLVKQFRASTAERIVGSVNKIFIDGIQFQ